MTTTNDTPDTPPGHRLHTAPLDEFLRLVFESASEVQTWLQPPIRNSAPRLRLAQGRKAQVSDLLERRVADRDGHYR